MKILQLSRCSPTRKSSLSIKTYNCPNDRYIAESIEEVKGVFLTKDPAQVMVPTIEASDGRRTPSNSFGAGEKVNTDCHYRVISYHVSPWISPNNLQGNCVWQQDGALVCMLAKNQKFCKDNIAELGNKKMWP